MQQNLSRMASHKDVQFLTPFNTQDIINVIRHFVLLKQKDCVILNNNHNSCEHFLLSTLLVLSR